MGQEDFFSKSKETLSAIATAFQLVTPEQAESMDKLELALMLDNEQRKANEAEDSKNKAEAAAVNPPPKEKTKRAASKKKIEKTPLEMMGDSMPETETISVVEEEKPIKEMITAKIVIYFFMLLKYYFTIKIVQLICQI